MNPYVILILFCLAGYTGGCSKAPEKEIAEPVKEPRAEDKIMIEGDTIRIEGSLTERQRLEEEARRQARLQEGLEIVSAQIKAQMLAQLFSAEGRAMTDEPWNQLLEQYQAKATEEETAAIQPRIEAEREIRKKKSELNQKQKQLLAMDKDSIEYDRLRTEINDLRDEIEIMIVENEMKA